MVPRILVAVVLVVALAATAPGQDFSATLDGLQESPPVVTTGTGTGIADFDPATNMLSVNLVFSDLIGTTTNSHIHCCLTTNPTAGVAVGFTATFPMGVTSGNFVNTYDLLDSNVYAASFLNDFGGGTAAGARDALLAAMRNGAAYFNIHTSFRPGGELRGAITPEPSSLGLAVSGLAAIAWLYRRRTP